MAISLAPQNGAAPIIDDASDYGSEIDDATADELFSQIESQPLKNVVLENIEEPVGEDEPLERRINLRLSRLQQTLDSVHESSSKIETLISDRQRREASIEVEYDEQNRISFSPSNREERAASEVAAEIPDKNDTRSPIERFRKRPKKPLSVTDLVSPAWCEQQYEYSLSKYGRVRKTPAMKQGSSVHQVLEEQVHVRVPIETVSNEDRFGLRLWNSIQGLRSLRETGLTRELEVWGVVEGEVVIGVIDEVSTTCPDEQMEAQMQEEAKAAGKVKKGGRNQELPSDQRTLNDFLTNSQNGSVLESNSAFIGTLHEKTQTFYIVDVKTRQSRSLPATGSSSRPTHMQLMLYHRLLSSLAMNEVSSETVFERYRLNPESKFSDKFLAEIANLDISSYASIPPDEDSAEKQDPLTEILAHNNLSSLWNLLTSEFSQTFPVNSSQSPISPLLTAEFRTAKSKYSTTDESELVEAAGALIGRRTFPFDADKIDAYVKDEMKWWKGERETKGVDVEEAFKCRICEFAEVCVWRATKVEEGLKKSRMRKEQRKRSEV